MKASLFSAAVICWALVSAPLHALEPLASRIAHTDPTKYRPSSSVHGGAGRLDFMALLDFHALDTNLSFLHRGIIEPKSGIGHHFHNNCEEMFVILDGEAQFTVDGRTSLLRGPAGAPSRMGHSHAIYNPTDKPVQWMNINVSALKEEYDNFDLNDTREDVVLDNTPVFMTMRLDRSLLRNVNAFHGGKGAVQYRRALGPSVFSTAWAFVDHIVLPPGATIGPHSYRGIAQFYYVMTGEGTVSVIARGQQDSAVIRTGDAAPIQLGEIHSLENTGTQPLELMVVGVARDVCKELESVDVNPAVTRKTRNGIGPLLHGSLIRNLTGARMKRRSYLSAMLAGLAGLKMAFAQKTKNPIVLYCDLSVAPAREQEMLRNFHTIFKPAAERFPGYLDLKMLKLRSAIQGSAPPSINYRFQLTYESEEARQKWIHSDVHQKAWPTVENTLSNKSDYPVLLFDSV